MATLWMWWVLFSARFGLSDRALEPVTATRRLVVRNE